MHTLRFEIQAPMLVVAKKIAFCSNALASRQVYPAVGATDHVLALLR